MKWRNLAVAGVAATALIAGAGPSSAAPERTTEVIQLAGAEIVDGCVGPLRYLTGEAHVTLVIVPNAAGGEVVHYSVRTVRATAVSLATGVIYRDQTHERITVQGNGTWFGTGALDGSHGVHTMSRISLFAPGTDEPQLVVRTVFHLRRVAGREAIPPVEFTHVSSVCE